MKVVKCIVCGEEYEVKRLNDHSKYCSNTCRYKDWYDHNKEKRAASRKNYYVPHPRRKKTEEEIIAYRKEYYKKHREYYLAKSREYHELHKNEEAYKKRKYLNVKNYYNAHKTDPEFMRLRGLYAKRSREKRLQGEKGGDTNDK